ncbi:hypothetical protein TIFTF001_047506 [Ficus carica]|uniref:Uncharacterized protein n=1 Tax=Ficus carica TaxID=3494 RepID=A0AA87Z2N2_FICCA|nr:hypothetical protein TIFTF001_047506 [Ficus carica]
MRLDLEDEEAKPSETSQVSVCHPKPANTFEQTVVNAEVQMCDVRSSSNKSQCGDECDKGQQLKIRQKTFQCSDPKPSNVLQHKVIRLTVDV